MIELVLPYPISANRYWASRVIKEKKTGKWMAMTYVTPAAKEYRTAIRDIVKAAGIKQPLAGRYLLELQLFPDRPLDWRTRMRKFGEVWDDSVRCIDLGNAEKVLSDALQGVVIGDDSLARRMVLDRMEPDSDPARVVVRISSMVAQPRQEALL
jgi:crossover junction endodeoxyribonuclease RusA